MERGLMVQSDQHVPLHIVWDINREPRASLNPLACTLQSPIEHMHPAVGQSQKPLQALRLERQAAILPNEMGCEEGLPARSMLNQSCPL